MAKKKTKEMSYDNYIAVRWELENKSFDSSNRFDTNIIAISTSAIGAWMYLLTKEWALIDCLNLLLASWVFLVISVWLTILSFNISQLALSTSVDKLDKEYEGTDSREEVSKLNSYWNKLDFLKWACPITMWLWIILLWLFILFNYTNV